MQASSGVQREGSSWISSLRRVCDATSWGTTGQRKKPAIPRRVDRA